MLASLLGLTGCAASDPGDSLAAIAAETGAPPAAESEQVEAAVAHWAEGRFTPGVPRWFTLKQGTPAVAAMKAVDNALHGAAKRIVETGPDGAGATMYGWRLRKASGDGHDGIVVAVSRGNPALAAYYPVKLSAGWPD